MTFQQWIDAVDRVLVAKKCFYRVKDVCPIALRDAFDRGDSPIAFGKLAKHPMKGDQDAGFRPTTRVSSFAIVGVGVFVGLLAIYIGRNLLRDREGAKIAEAGPFPRRLPYDTSYGRYTPPDAEEAISETRDEVSRQLMARRSATFSDLTVDKIVGPGEYLLSGEVEGRNKYGANLSTPFEARAIKRIERANRRGPTGAASWMTSVDLSMMGGQGGGWVCLQRGSPKIGEWRVLVRMDRAIGDSQIDRMGTPNFNRPMGARKAGIYYPR